MARAFVIVMDGVGIGGAPDAADFGDAGSNTVLHIARAAAAAGRGGGRAGPLRLPVLDGLGLGAAVRLAAGEDAPGLGAPPQGLWGAATEVSRGKDTPSGHWELAGVPVPWEWTTFPDTRPAFPPELAREAARLAGTEGILGNCRASGTEIIEALGAEHLRTLWPICYTSADSVFQIAAHEEAFGLDRLLALCAALAPRLHAMRVGRAIARPFTGSPATGFVRTPNRRDFAIAPPAPTLLDRARAAGREVIGIGKIGDIFSGRGLGELRKGKSDLELSEHLARAIAGAADGSLTFANFIEFDSLWGHRRDALGFAAALETFDGWAGGWIAAARAGDLLLFTADHGNDPCWRGTDHTRERVPVLGHGLGRRAAGLVAFADVGATVADHLGLPAAGPGRSFR